MDEFSNLQVIVLQLFFRMSSLNSWKENVKITKLHYFEFVEYGCMQFTSDSRLEKLSAVFCKGVFLRKSILGSDWFV